MSEDEFSLQLLFSAINNASGFDWGDFENALGYFNFSKKLPRRSKEAQEKDEDQDIWGYLHAVDMISNLMIQSTNRWQDFFRDWIKSVERKLECEKYQPIPNLLDLFNEQDNLYLTFNYTKVLQRIYGINNVIHIHNRVGQKLIFGHGDDKATYKETIEDGGLGSSFLNDLLKSFRKDNVSPMRKYSDFFRKLNGNVDTVYSYGFGYSKADAIYIKTIIDKIAADSIWHFTEYEANDKEQLRKKKVKLRKYGFRGTFGVF